MLKSYFIAVIVLAGALSSYCQNAAPDMLEQGTIPEQFKFLEERTRIYENYRAIREDMYQKISRNSIDTLKKAKNRINELALHTATLNNRIDSLNKSLESANNNLAKATRTKDSLSVLGMEVNKLTYNTVMWILLAAAAVTSIAAFFARVLFTA